MADETQAWNKAERLQVAGLVAPRLRDQDDRTKSRRVAKVDAAGNVVGYVSLADVQKGLLRKQEIEFDVADGVRPKERLCRLCGRPFRVPLIKGRVPTVCLICRDPLCQDCGTVLKKRGTQLGQRRAVRCGKCRHLAGRGPLRMCPDCGGPISRDRRTVRCERCRPARTIEPVLCADCKKPLTRRACRRAHERENASLVRCLRCRQTPRPAPHCSVCSKALNAEAMSPRMVAKRGGRLPTCVECARKARVMPRATCSMCSAILSRAAMCPSLVRKRNGAPPKCGSCHAKSAGAGRRFVRSAVQPASRPRRDDMPKLAKKSAKKSAATKVKSTKKPAGKVAKRAKKTSKKA